MYLKIKLSTYDLVPDLKYAFENLRKTLTRKVYILDNDFKRSFIKVMFATNVINNICFNLLFMEDIDYNEYCSQALASMEFSYVKEEDNETGIFGYFNIINGSHWVN
jgi:hypothetical protein